MATTVIASLGFATDSMSGLALGAGSISIALLPPYALGAHARATMSDAIERRQMVERLVEAWVRTRMPQTGSATRIGLQVHELHGDAFVNVWEGQSPQVPILPAPFTARLEEILTAPIGKMPPARLKDASLQHMIISHQHLSAHERLAMHNRLVDAGLADLARWR